MDAGGVPITSPGNKGHPVVDADDEPSRHAPFGDVILRRATSSSADINLQEALNWQKSVL